MANRVIEDRFAEVFRELQGTVPAELDLAFESLLDRDSSAITNGPHAEVPAQAGLEAQLTELQSIPHTE